MKYKCTFEEKINDNLTFYHNIWSNKCYDDFLNNIYNYDYSRLYKDISIHLFDDYSERMNIKVVDLYLTIGKMNGIKCKSNNVIDLYKTFIFNYYLNSIKK